MSVDLARQMGVQFIGIRPETRMDWPYRCEFALNIRSHHVRVQCLNGVLVKGVGFDGYNPSEKSR